MVNYKVRLTNQTTFVTSTFDGNSFCQYTDRLNNVDEASVKLPASTPETRELFEVGINNKVEILKNGVVEFTGYPVGKSFLDGGGISLRCVSKLALLSRDGYDADEKWIKKPTSVIAGDIISDGGFNAGTIENAFTLDFKAKVSSSYLNVLQNLRKKTNQDLYFKDSDSTVNLVDHKGSETSVMTLNDGLDFVNPIFDQLEPKGNKIIVYGSGVGNQRIVSEYPAHGQNSDSQTNWGLIVHTETDPTIVSTLEANKLADVLAIVYGSAIKSYKFDLVNPSLDLESGDVITLNSLEKDIISEEVRISEIERGCIGGNEFLTLTVANKEYSQVFKKRNEVLGGTNRKVRDTDTYTDGSENTLNYVNAQNSSMNDTKEIILNLAPEDVLDFAGNPRINSVTVDYKIEGALQNTAYGINNDSTINGDGLALEVHDAKTTFYGASVYTTDLPITTAITDMTFLNIDGETYLFMCRGSSTQALVYKYDKANSKEWDIETGNLDNISNMNNCSSFEYNDETYLYVTGGASNMVLFVWRSGAWQFTSDYSDGTIQEDGLPVGQQNNPDVFWDNGKLYCLVADDDYLTTGNSRLVFYQYSFTGEVWIASATNTLLEGLPYTELNNTSVVGLIKHNTYTHLGRLYMIHIVDASGIIDLKHYIWNYDSWELATDAEIPYTMQVDGLTDSNYDEAGAVCVGYVSNNLMYMYYDSSGFPVARVTRNTFQLLNQEWFDGLEGYNLPLSDFDSAGVYKIIYSSNILSATLLDYATINVNIKHQKTN
jgi:hypothetical protein